MGLEEAAADLLEEGGANNNNNNISCSICLEDVTDFGDRAWAKLQCSHLFHLDCIGSAFNVKGAMQCPNCRKVEKGQWLYADGHRPYPDLNIDDLVNDDQVYELSFSEASMWCPYSGFTQLAAAFEEVDFPAAGYHDLVGQHAVFNEHGTVSSATHICPYVAYVQPIHPSTSSNTSANVPEGPSRPARTNADMSRGSYVHHPFVVGQSSTRAPSSNSSYMTHPGSAARAQERSQAFQAYFQQPTNSPAMRTPLPTGPHRSNGQVQISQYGTSSDQTRGWSSSYNLSASSVSSEHNIWERDPNRPFHQSGGGSFRYRNGSDGTQSQSQHWFFTTETIDPRVPWERTRSVKLEIVRRR
uniref:RING-type domain-containing protein n=1 Tax=Tanacetum cinerariifolium TaxID=118510 RepID=A0A6L2MK58_TANCI|nr:hypothetical protein [Tanacetum cinerariifolium]